MNKLWFMYNELPIQENFDALVVGYLPYIHKVSKNISINNSFDRDDLVQSGVFGLMEAVERYDESRNAKFNTFAIKRIKGSMIDFVRTQDYLSRNTREHNLGYNIPHVSGYTEIYLSDVAVTLFDLIGKDSEINDTEDFWRTFLRGCTKRVRLIMIMYYRLEITMSKIAKNLELTESRISQIISHELRRLKKCQTVQNWKMK